MRTTGAMLAGRCSYDVGARDDQEANGGACSAAQFVLTHKPRLMLRKIRGSPSQQAAVERAVLGPASTSSSSVEAGGRAGV
jgi:hypothetical protein